MEKKKKYKLTIFADLKDFPREVSEITGDFIGEEGLKEARSYGIGLIKKIIEEDRFFLKDRGAGKDGSITASVYPTTTINAVHMRIEEIKDDKEVYTEQGREEV